MKNTWFISDLHFGHANIIVFTDEKGDRMRPFFSVEEHDETIIRNHNDLVRPEDRVYVTGDVAMDKAHIEKVGRLNGRKVLIKGNHDIFTLADYTPYFEDIRACKIYREHGLIVSHIPVHAAQLEHRWKANAHGHNHSKLVTVANMREPDRRYINLCLEQTHFRPVSLDDVVQRIPQ